MVKPNPKEFDNSLKLIVKSSFIVLIGLILSKIFTYAYKIIIARYYGPEIYGLFSLATMILGLFVVFSSLGLSEGLLRYIPLYRGRSEINKIKYILKFSLTILLFSSILFGIALFFLSEFISIHIFHNPPLIIFLKWFSFLVPVSIFLNILLSLIRAYEKISSYSFITNILQPTLSLVVVLFFIFLGLKTNAIIPSYVISLLIALLISFLICKYKLSDAFGRYLLTSKNKKRIAWDMFSYSWPLIFLSVLTSILVWTDSFMIGYFVNVLQVGDYNVATTFVNLLNFASSIMILLFYPLAVRAFSTNKKKLIKDLSQQIIKWVLIINLPILIIFILFPGAIINLFFGADYLVAENSLRILSLGAFIFSALVISKDLISMEGRSKTLLIDLLVISLLNFFLNLILIPKFGINGAAFSTSISLLILGLIFALQSRDYLPAGQLIKKTWKIILVSIPLHCYLSTQNNYSPKMHLA
jgi:O-antigen/teichoic acid export membrane protein